MLHALNQIACQRVIFSSPSSLPWLSQLSVLLLKVSSFRGRCKKPYSIWLGDNLVQENHSSNTYKASHIHFFTREMNAPARPGYVTRSHWLCQSSVMSILETSHLCYYCQGVFILNVTPLSLFTIWALGDRRWDRFKAPWKQCSDSPWA